MVHRVSLVVGKVLITAGVLLLLNGKENLFMVLALLMGGLLALASHGLNLVHACEMGTGRLRSRVRLLPRDHLFFASFFLVNCFLWSTLSVPVSAATKQFLLAVFLAMVASIFLGAWRELFDEEPSPG